MPRQFDPFQIVFNTVDASKSKVGVNINLLADSGTAENIKKGAITTNPAMLDGEGGYQVVPLLTVGESVPGATGASYTPVGILDGIGAFKLELGHRAHLCQSRAGAECRRHLPGLGRCRRHV